MALTLEAQRNETVAQVGVLVAAAAGSKQLEEVYWGLNPQAKQLAQLEARRKIDPITAALVLQERYPPELLKLIPLETLTLAAAKRAVLPPGHIRVLGGSGAWACNCRLDPKGLWCGVLVVFAPGETTLTDWESGQSYRVVIPPGVVGGTDVVLEVAR